MRERGIIVTLTPFQIDRFFQLAETVKKINFYEQMLKQGKRQTIVETVGRQKTLEIDDQFIKGMKKCAFSFYVDLKEENLKVFANEILERAKPQTTTVK